MPSSAGRDYSRALSNTRRLGRASFKALLQGRCDEFVRLSVAVVCWVWKTTCHSSNVFSESIVSASRWNRSQMA